MRTRSVPAVLLATLAAGGLLVSVAATTATGPCVPRAWAAPPASDPREEMTVVDHQNLERNLRWVLAREREHAARVAKEATVAAARVGVVADAGVWHPSARGVVDALEAAGVPCIVLDRTLVTKAGLEGLEAIVLPGGWAPYQVAAWGPEGVAALRGFVEDGGRALGICAGAYAMAKDVRWDGAVFPYPLGFFDGTADGPVAGLAVWPARAPVRLAVDAPGKARGLAPFATTDVLYYGGGRFVGGSGVTVLARYPDGSAAIVERRVGKGLAVLCGAHLERPAPAAGGDDAGPPALAGPALEALLLGRR